MPSLRLNHRVPAALGGAILAVALLAACGDGTTASDDASPPGGEPTVRVDWTSRTVTGVEGDVTVAFCDGDAPFICFSRGEEHLGTVELGAWPATTHDVIKAVRDRGGDDRAALEAMAADFVEVFAADRPKGCGPGYEVVADEPVPAAVGGRQGIRYGFRGVVDGRTVEQVVNHAVLDGDTVWLFSAAGYDEAGCLPREGGFDIDGIDRHGGLITQVVAGSRLPTTLPGGVEVRTLTARVTGIHAASASVEVDALEVLSGEEARVAAVRAGVIAEGEDLPNDVFLLDEDATTERFTVDPSATVEVYDCRTDCKRAPAMLDDFLWGRVRPYGGDRAVWAVTVTDGRLTSLAEVYLP